MAKCLNCGAPLLLKTTTCAYCGTVNDVDIRRVVTVAPTDQQENRTCPRCSCTLTTIDLSGNDSFHIDRCEKCYGLFFDSGELEMFLNGANASNTEVDHQKLSHLINENFHKEYPVCYIKCPVCSQLMNRINYGKKSGVIVNKCSDHGLWLDSGMLHHLVGWVKAGGLEIEREHQSAKLQEEAAYQMLKTREAAALHGSSIFEKEFDLVSLVKTLFKVLH